MEFISNVLLPIVLPLIGALCALGMFMMRRLMERIDKLEHNQQHMVTREETRTLINDRVDPIKQQINSVDHKLDKIMQILLSKR